MGRPTVPARLTAAGTALGAAVLCSCSGGGAATPRVSSTPPPVQSTVALGVTRLGTSGAPAGHVMSDGHTMSGMSMPGMSMPGTSPAHGGAAGPSLVPNGTGSHVVAAPNVDGCNRAYGTVAQCVPLRAPGGGPLTCAFLRAYHYLPLLVTEDPLHLLTGRGADVRVSGGKRYLTGCSA